MIILKEKQRGSMKLIIIVSGVIVAAGIITGLVFLVKNLKFNDQPSIEDQQLGNAATTGFGEMRQFQEGFSEASAEDLKVGDYVMIEGTENQDGSISANVVFIGSSAEDFADMPSGRPDDFSTSTPPVIDGTNMPNRGQAPTDMPNMPEGLENMTQEERRQMMEELRNSGELPDSMVRSKRVAGNAFLRGELLGKTDQLLTIKIAEGGSQLVLYSETMQFMKKQ